MLLIILATEQNDSVIHISILFQILLHYKLLQDTKHEYVSLCYTVCLAEQYFWFQMVDLALVDLALVDLAHALLPLPS